MKFWLFTVAILFVLVQLFEWVKGFMLPLPVYILGGAFLAIASNYEKGLSSLLATTPRQTETASQREQLVKSKETGELPATSD